MKLFRDKCKIHPMCSMCTFRMCYSNVQRIYVQMFKLMGWGASVINVMGDMLHILLFFNYYRW